MSDPGTSREVDGDAARQSRGDVARQSRGDDGRQSPSDDDRQPRDVDGQVGGRGRAQSRLGDDRQSSSGDDRQSSSGGGGQVPGRVDERSRGGQSPGDGHGQVPGRGDAQSRGDGDEQSGRGAQVRGGDRQSPSGDDERSRSGSDRQSPNGDDERSRSGSAEVPTVAEAGGRYTALWWAKVQSAGPLLVSPETPAVAGLTRAPEPDGRGVWMLPALPEGAGHGVLDELGTPPVAVEQPNETARVLAICLTCCWPDRSGPAWPGVPATLAQVKAVYAGFRGRAEQSSDLTLIVGSLRRLHATSWLIWHEKAGEVRLGPRVVSWGPGQLAGLREVCRILPDPPPAASPPPQRAPDLPPRPVAASDSPIVVRGGSPAAAGSDSADASRSESPVLGGSDSPSAAGSNSAAAAGSDLPAAGRIAEPGAEDPAGLPVDEGGQRPRPASYGPEGEVSG